MKIKIVLNVFFLCIFALLISNIQSFYCSAYCTNFWDGGSYVPKCTDQTSLTCTKCDEILFSISGSQCVSHGLFNETLFIQDLNPASTSTGWTNVNANAYFTTISAIYDVMYFDASDRYYKDFTLPPHFAIRVRFFALRQAASSFNFKYYIDSKSYVYSYNNFPSSQTLGDIITTDLINHQDLTLSIAFQATSFSLGQFIGIKQLMVFVSKCSSGCLMCSSAQNCVGCGMIGASQSYLYEQKCYTLCPQTTFPNTSSLQCQKCNPQCYNCNTNSSYCTQCVFQGRYQTFLYNNTCYYTCPYNYSPNYDTNTCQCPSILTYINATTNFCTTCSIECQTCFGSLRTQCTTCISGYYLVYGTTWCSNTCPSDQYQNSFNNKCYPCADVCSSCQNTSTTCTGCFFVTMKYLYQNTCVLSCPDGYQINNISRKCDACASYEYSFNNTCSLQCPPFYMASNQSKSCVHLSLTNFTYSIQITNIQILFDGKTMQIFVDFTQGLDSISIDWLLRQSYFNVLIQIGEQKSSQTSSRLLLQKELNNFKTQRLLIVQNYNVRGVSMQSNTFVFTTQVPSSFSYNQQFIINFGQRLKNPSNISYANTSLYYSIVQDPQLLRQYYMRTQKYFYNIALIPLIFLSLLLVLIRIKGSYQLTVEYFRMMQLIGLSIFAAYPFKSQIYYLLEGFNYFNLQFFPNIYNWFVFSFSNAWAVEGFVFYYGDMDFIRLIGSILIFFVVSLFSLIVLKYLIKTNTQNIGWCVKLCMDLAQIKIMHSFWSSLIFTFGNTSSTNLVMYLVHIISYVFMGFLIYRQLKLYQTSEQINWLFFWRLTATLLIVVAAFSKLLVFIIYFIMSALISSLYYIRWPVNQCKNYKFGFSVEIRNLAITLFPMFSVFISCLIMFYENQLTEQLAIMFVLLLVYIIFLIVVFISICLNYLQKQKCLQLEQQQMAKNKALKIEYYQELNKSTKSLDIYYDNKQQDMESEHMSYMARKTGMQPRTQQMRDKTENFIIQDQPIQKKFHQTNQSQYLTSGEVIRRQLDEVGEMQIKQFRQ